MNIVWIASRPGPVKRFQVSLPPPPKMPALQAHRRSTSSLTEGSLKSHAASLDVELLARFEVDEEHVPVPV